MSDTYTAPSEEDLQDWYEFISSKQPLIDLMVEKGCDVGIALLLIQLNFISQQLDLIHEQVTHPDPRPFDKEDDWFRRHKQEYGDDEAG